MNVEEKIIKEKIGYIGEYKILSRDESLSILNDILNNRIVMPKPNSPNIIKRVIKKVIVKLTWWYFKEILENQDKTNKNLSKIFLSIMLEENNEKTNLNE